MSHAHRASTIPSEISLQPSMNALLSLKSLAVYKQPSCMLPTDHSVLLLCCRIDLIPWREVQLVASFNPLLLI